MKKSRKTALFLLLFVAFFVFFSATIPLAMGKEQKSPNTNPVQMTAESVPAAIVHETMKSESEAAEAPQTEKPQETIPHIILNVETQPQPRTVSQTATNTEEKTEDSMKSLGVFRLTAYCSCEICCGKWSQYNKTYSGTTPKVGRTIAVDKNQIPIGSKVMIDGHIYTAEDTGSAIHENCIDIYHDSHQEAKLFGVQHKEVFLITEKE